ncbi:D-lactate ferricytochrome c oxidoreductase [Microbotryomycetes sp. JL221]|nr:D-lactate ferricytochrome c oxidoreductase [Microbotryomycetes sp. JL221]
MATPRAGTMLSFAARQATRSRASAGTRCLCLSSRGVASSPTLLKLSGRVRQPSTTVTASFSTSALRQGGQLPDRDNKFKKLTTEDVVELRQLLSTPDSSLITTIKGSEWTAADVSDLDGYNNDWMDKYHGKSQVLIKPKTTEEVSKVLQYCYRHTIAVVPQGGNTGLVGGGVPVYDEVIISTEAMNQVREFDDVSGILTTDAGAILESLSNYLTPKGYMMPLDLGAKGSCHIGGNVATNAGGLRLLRYGSLHGTVLGIEAVLPDEKGTILSVGMPGGRGGALRKDNTGYDLKQLFIGSEGTLGIITGVSILTPKLPTAVNVAVLSVPDFNKVQTVYKETRTKLGEILSAFEFFDQEGLELVLKHTGQKAPFDGEPEGGKAFYVLIETSGSNKDHDDEKLAGLLEHLMESEIVSDGVLAQDETQIASLWSLRESLPEAVGKLGKAYKYDLSMPVKDMYSLVEEARARFKEHGLDNDGNIKLTIGYGHLGDGNLHLNIVASQWDDKIEKVIEPWVYEATAQRNGSISAEHGLGVMKAPYVGYSKSDESIDWMQRLRDLFDPRGILSPYKYLPKAQQAPARSKENMGAHQTNAEKGH